MDRTAFADISDDDLLNELKVRFEQKNKALKDLRTMHDKLDLAHTRLLEADALKSHFLGIIRNEIKNPLAAISGLARLLAEKKVVDQNRLIEIMETIVGEAHHLSFQLDNILEAALLEAGEQHLVRHSVDPAAMIRDILQEQAYDIKAKGLAVTTDLEDHLRIVADGAKVKLILANVISNAVKFNQDQGAVHIRLKGGGETVEITVADTGEGIRRQDARLIFERFKQADMGIARKHGGTGLGLSVAVALTGLLGGKIRHEPRPGGGTTFYVTLPRSGHDQALCIPGHIDDRDETGDAVLF
ncbi:MAG: HAMP domain-containing histidine kinase [Deltaproteobacteria bacterium]|nr:HAMP domain-containing histidine kinase [Deltaproteobacteria bacterium]